MATRFDITRRDLMKTGVATAVVMTPSVANTPGLKGIYRIPPEITLRFNVSHAKPSAAVPPQPASSQNQ